MKRPEAERELALGKQPSAGLGKQSLTYTVQQQDPQDPTKTVQAQMTKCCGNATIGYGHLVHLGPLVPAEAIDDGSLKLRALEQPFINGIDQTKANQLFELDVTDVEGILKRKMVWAAGLTQNQFDALVSLGFNNRGGFLHAIHMINNGSTGGTADYIRALNSKSKGLNARRKKEANLFMNGTPLSRYYLPAR